MKKAILSVFLLLAASWQMAVAADAAPAKSPSTYGSKGYVWGEMTKERTEILKLKGDATKGKDAFRGCKGGHKADAAGLADGTYPRLTGQHRNVIIKQVTEVRAGIRINPKMDPFSDDHAVSPQEIADIASYLTAVQSTRDNGKGPLDMSAKGKTVYEDNKCFKCHGRNGEGDDASTYPAVAAQHYGYLLREMRYIQAGVRGNSHPEMVKAINKFAQADLEAVADYLSRLPDFRTVAHK